MVRVALVVLSIVLAAALLDGRQPAAVAQEPLSISGSVWFDENGDGARQPDEEALTLFVVLQTAAGREIVRTDRQGIFRFEGLAPGNYLVDATQESGFTSFIQTYPNRKYIAPYVHAVTLTDASMTGVDIGLSLPEGLPMFGGLVWVNGEPPSGSGRVRAYVDGTDCTGPAPIRPPDSPRNQYSLSVLSSEMVPGCGDPGDQIRFMVGGLQANEVATWQRVDGPFFSAVTDLELTVGPPFVVVDVAAVTTGYGTQSRGLYGPVVALIDGNVCATGASFGAVITIPSRELVAGCGYEGAAITFAVTGLLAKETVVWKGGLRADVRLTVVTAPGSPMAGPPFAYFRLALPAGAGATATIGDIHCGSAASSGESGLAVVAVAPDELDSGCGYEGAPVKINVYQRGVIVAQVDVLWRGGQFRDIEWQVAAPQETAKDPVGVRPPGVGDGGLRP